MLDDHTTAPITKPGSHVCANLGSRGICGVALHLSPPGLLGRHDSWSHCENARTLLQKNNRVSKQHGQALECLSTGDSLVAGLDAEKPQYGLPVPPAACSKVFRPTALVRQCSTLVSMRQDLSRLATGFLNHAI